MLKMLITALALSPSSKAVTTISKTRYVIVDEHWTSEQLYYSVHVVDLETGRTPFATATNLKGWNAMGAWMLNVVKWSGVSIDIYENQWQTLEEAFR